MTVSPFLDSSGPVSFLLSIIICACIGYVFNTLTFLAKLLAWFCSQAISALSESINIKHLLITKKPIINKIYLKHHKIYKMIC